MANVTDLKAAPPRLEGRSWMWLGAAAALLGLAGYVFQFFVLKWMTVPWYAAILASAGVALMLVAFLRTPRVGRGIVLVLFALLAGFEWFFLLHGSLLPTYRGPATLGVVPEFTTTLADGRPFTDRDLEKGQPTVLVFFRGRW